VQEKENRKIYSLKKLSESLQSIIRKTYNSSYWIKAEISKLNYYSHSGHCYPDLVEKENETVVAQIRAIIWSTNFRKIQKQFIRLTGEKIDDNMEVLINAKVDYNPKYGLSLIIQDIDPNFTLGKLARDKFLSIERLKKENLFDKNKKLEFPILPKKLAIISVETSKGYSDLINILDNNSKGYVFEYELFPALLQGEKAVGSILAQLNYIKSKSDKFDLIAIIRGGGGEVGLSAYDNYDLASEIAKFPLPVITGIGHSTNDTVCEMISFKNAITPTDVAYYLIEKFDVQAGIIEELKNSIIDFSIENIRTNKSYLNDFAKALKSANSRLMSINDIKLNQAKAQLNYASKDLVKASRIGLDNFSNKLNKSALRLISASDYRISEMRNKLKSELKFYFAAENSHLNSLESKVKYSDPKNMLKKGYSISFVDGKILNKNSKLKKGDKLITKYLHGEIESEIEKIKYNERKN